MGSPKPSLLVRVGPTALNRRQLSWTTIWVGSDGRSSGTSAPAGWPLRLLSADAVDRARFGSIDAAAAMRKTCLCCYGVVSLCPACRTRARFWSIRSATSGWFFAAWRSIHTLIRGLGVWVSCLPCTRIIPDDHWRTRKVGWRDLYPGHRGSVQVRLPILEPFSA